MARHTRSDATRPRDCDFDPNLQTREDGRLSPLRWAAKNGLSAVELVGMVAVIQGDGGR